MESKRPEKLLSATGDLISLSQSHCIGDDEQAFSKPSKPVFWSVWDGRNPPSQANVADKLSVTHTSITKRYSCSLGDKVVRPILVRPLPMVGRPLLEVWAMLVHVCRIAEEPLLGVLRGEVASYYSTRSPLKTLYIPHIWIPCRGQFPVEPECGMSLLSFLL